MEDGLNQYIRNDPENQVSMDYDTNLKDEKNPGYQIEYPRETDQDTRLGYMMLNEPQVSNEDKGNETDKVLYTEKDSRNYA